MNGHHNIIQQIAPW